jgi:putative exosortase-associated protein (TIGR04073 family)
MIKRLFFAIVVLALIISSATPAFCAESTTKLGRGVCNMLTFPMEIPEQISRVNNSDGPLAASTVGVLKGVGWALGRAFTGLYETITFMSPGSNNYEAIMKDPEYFLSDATL